LIEESLLCAAVAWARKEGVGGGLEGRAATVAVDERTAVAARPAAVERVGHIMLRFHEGDTGVRPGFGFYYLGWWDKELIATWYSWVLGGG
jgi:hypothetical protein